MAQATYFQLILSVLLLLHLPAASPQITTFTYENGFSPVDFTLTGSAAVSSAGLLSMTGSNLRTPQTGSAFFSKPLQFNNPLPSSFSTNFVFAVVADQSAKAHRVGFAISSRNQIEVGPVIPFFNHTANFTALDNTLTVEFRRIPNPNLPEFDSSYVYVKLGSSVPVAVHKAGYYSEDGQFTDLNALGGDPIQAWVEYDGRDRRINITLAPVSVRSKPGRPVCSGEVNLSRVLLDEMYVGFYGTALVTPISQYVLGWSFRLNGHCNLLDPSKLPSLPRTEGRHKTSIALTVVLAHVALVAVAAVIGVVYVVWKRRVKYAEELEAWEVEYGPHRISYRDLYRATKGFKESELLGTGGFGKVYRGVLPRSNVEVAVKRVSHDSRQGMREFVAEVVTLGRLRHRNLVALLGYCRRKGELLLVYDYMPNGSLDRVLFADTWAELDWDRRLNIIKGVAAGLLYLHEEWEQVVVHRDVKSSNVMLDRDYNARLGDFGLARLSDHGTALQTTKVVGTMGYLAPELSRLGRASKATDVFAFGVFVLEVVCGRKPIEPKAASGEVVLVDWIVRRWVGEGMNLTSSADGRMAKGTYAAGEVEMVMKLGLLCAHAAEEARPSMRQVVQVLEGDLAVPELPLDYWKGCVGVGSVWGVGDGEGGGWDYTSNVLSGAPTSGPAFAGDTSMFFHGGR